MISPDEEAAIIALWEPHLIALGTLPDGRLVGAQIQLYTARLVVGLDKTGCQDDYTYETPDAAVRAMLAWIISGDTEPSGWIRNPKTARRRPGGDPTKEYIYQ